MKLLKRNLKSFSYCLLTGSEKVYDAYGNETGTVAVYGDAYTIQGNISASTGEAQIEMFGNADYYSKVIIVDDMNCPIDENSVLFIDKDPEFLDETDTFDYKTPLYNYVVKRVAEYLDYKAYAVEKVSVS